MAKSKFNETELSVCDVCRYLIAYGEYNDGEDTAETASAGIARIWGDDAKHFISDGAALGYCISSCDACGNTDHGERFRATALIPA